MIYHRIDDSLHCYTNNHLELYQNDREVLINGKQTSRCHILFYFRIINSDIDIPENFEKVSHKIGNGQHKKGGSLWGKEFPINILHILKSNLRECTIRPRET